MQSQIQEVNTLQNLAKQKIGKDEAISLSGAHQLTKPHTLNQNFGEETRFFTQSDDLENYVYVGLSSSLLRDPDRKEFNPEDQNWSYVNTTDRLLKAVHQAEVEMDCVGKCKTKEEYLRLVERLNSLIRESPNEVRLDSINAMQNLSIHESNAENQMDCVQGGSGMDNQMQG